MVFSKIYFSNAPEARNGVPPKIWKQSQEIESIRTRRQPLVLLNDQNSRESPSEEMYVSHHNLFQESILPIILEDFGGEGFCFQEDGAPPHYHSDVRS